MSVMKRIYSYMGDAKPEPITGGDIDLSQSVCFQFCLSKDPKITRQTRISVILSVISALGEDTPVKFVTSLIYISCNGHPVIYSFAAGCFEQETPFIFPYLLERSSALLPPPLAPSSVLHFLFFFLPFLHCPFLDHPVCFLFHLLPSLGFPAWYICLPSPRIPSFPSHRLVLVSFQLIPSLAPL